MCDDVICVMILSMCVCDSLNMQGYTQVASKHSGPAVVFRRHVVDCNLSCRQPCAGCVTEVCQWTLHFVDGEWWRVWVCVLMMGVWVCVLVMGMCS